MAFYYQTDIKEKETDSPIIDYCGHACPCMLKYG